MKQGRDLVSLAQELKRQAETKKDYLLNTNQVKMVITNDTIPEMDVLMGTKNGMNEVQRFGIKDIAHRQLAQHLNIPQKYYDRMKTEFPILLSTNVNAWLCRNPERRMFRTLDGNIRAILSDRYRRIDHIEVMEVVLPILTDIKGLEVVSCEITDSKLYFKVLNPMLKCEVVPGDEVIAGLMITNSETGQGSVQISPLVYRQVCKNGLIADFAMKKYHIGRTNESDENFNIFRDETLMQEDKAFLMKIEDTVRASMNQMILNQNVERLRAGREMKIEPTAINQVIDITQKEFNLTNEEGKRIFSYLVEGGDLSLYGLTNAITRFSQDVESYDRATELEATGWKVLNMDRRLWRQMNAV